MFLRGSKIFNSHEYMVDHRFSLEQYLKIKPQWIEMVAFLIEKEALKFGKIKDRMDKRCLLFFLLRKRDQVWKKNQDCSLPIEHSH